MSGISRHMPRLSVGHFPSLPWIPQYVAREAWPVRLVRCESSGVRSLVDRAQLEVTPMAAADWFTLDGTWRRLGNLGISFAGQAGSVLMFSQQRIEDMDSAELAICAETTSSVRLLQAIMTGRYGLRIGHWHRQVDESESRTARLLIQNQAVAELARKRFRYVYDLGEMWADWQKVPTVTAVWVYRSDCLPEEAESVELLLRESMRVYRSDPEKAIAAHKAEFAWPGKVSDVARLHENFVYDLGPDQLAGLERMRQVMPAEVEGFKRPRAAAAALA